MIIFMELKERDPSTVCLWLISLICLVKKERDGGGGGGKVLINPCPYPNYHQSYYGEAKFCPKQNQTCKYTVRYSHFESYIICQIKRISFAIFN